MGLIIAILSLLLLYALLVRGRKAHPGLEALRGWAYAHRGLHGNGIPENSMAAFRAALEAGYGIELDIHLLKDGSLAVIHDHSLARTTGCDGKIEDLTAGELANYPLEGTAETIPNFREVLELYAGKAPLIIELKAIDGNHAALCEAACKAMDGYQGPWCMESFDPRCIRWLRLHRPDIIRGQLAENFMAAKSNPLHPVLKFGITHQMGNFLIHPDFVAYKFADRKTLGNFLARKFWGVQGVTWTLRSQAEFDAAVKEGWLPIFEGFRP
jgi:glycerophosphoryl diester phosphodiesterase